MKKIVQKYSKASSMVAAALFMTGAAIGNANAALSWTGITLNTLDVESAMQLIIVGLATLWGFRKIIKTVNRS